MTILSFSEIEESLLRYRLARPAIHAMILEWMLSNASLQQPFWLLNRYFVRLKSADSIVEKIKRKNLNVNSSDELHRLISDALGMRIITGNLDELKEAVVFIERTFQVRSKKNCIDEPNEFGYRSIEYVLEFFDPQQGLSIPFEIQLRTYFQHIWSVDSFHLFHKQPVEKAQPYQETLKELSSLLAKAELLVSGLPKPALFTENQDAKIDLNGLPVWKQVNLVVILPGERFIQHLILPHTGDYLVDHRSVVQEKLRLYQDYPGCAVVECWCMDMTTYALNESHVLFPPARFNHISW